MNLEIVILSEVRQTQISYNTAYMWNLKKKKYKGPNLQNRNRITDIKNKPMVTIRGEG